MLENVVPILKNYADYYDSVTEEFEKKKSQIHEWYSEKIAIEADKQASEEYNNNLNATQYKYVKELEQVFENAKNELLAIVSVDFSDEFIKQFEILKSVPLSEREFESLVEKYKDNYIAVKILAEIAEKNDIIFTIVPLDEKLAELDTLEPKCIDFIKKYKGKGTDYTHELLLRGGLIEEIDKAMHSNVKYLHIPSAPCNKAYNKVVTAGE